MRRIRRFHFLVIAATLGVPGSIVGCGGGLGGGGKGGSSGAAGTGSAGRGGADGTGTGGATGSGGAAGRGGSGGAGGSGGSGGTTGTGGAGGLCVEPAGSMARCEGCTAANCLLGPDGTDGCCGMTDPTDQTLCSALYACIVANTGSCTSFGDPTKCFCGTNDATCFSTAGAANGPCAAQFIAAAKTSDPTLIQARFVSPKFPIGRAVNLSACRGGLCMSECGLE